MADEQNQAAVLAALAAKFPRGAVLFRPGSASRDRKKAMALAYLTARAIQDRLDAVLGPAGWKDDYERFPDGTILCRLSVRLGGEWITKCDVGAPSEQPDPGDRTKAAFSDSIKRAAVKWGLGRYLYDLPTQWVELDESGKKFAREPALAPSALPPALDGKQLAESAARAGKALMAAKSGPELKKVWDVAKYHPHREWNYTAEQLSQLGEVYAQASGRLALSAGQAVTR